MEKEILRLSFAGAEGEPSPMVVIYNSSALTPGISRQVERYGLRKHFDKDASLSGKLQGSRKDFLAVLQSYGVHFEIVPASSSGSPTGE